MSGESCIVVRISNQQLVTCETEQHECKCSVSNEKVLHVFGACYLSLTREWTPQGESCIVVHISNQQLVTCETEQHECKYSVSNEKVLHVSGACYLSLTREWTSYLWGPLLCERKVPCTGNI